MPTQTYYTFECGGVKLDVIFTAPLLMDNLDLMSRPVIMLPIRLLLPTGNRMKWEYISRRLPSGRNTAFFSLYNVS